MRTNRIRQGLAVGAMCVVAAGLVACGDDDTDKGSGGTTAADPHEVFAPDPVVATGLNQLVTVATGVADTPDEAAAKRAAEGLEPVWEEVEGTVKRNEPDLYATIEEDLSLLESGEPAKTRQGAAELDTTVKAYLAKHPG